MTDPQPVNSRVAAQQPMNANVELVSFIIRVLLSDKDDVSITIFGVVWGHSGTLKQRATLAGFAPVFHSQFRSNIRYPQINAIFNGPACASRATETQSCLETGQKRKEE
jgi:hypothetical protein